MTPTTKIAFANVIYFKSFWFEPFEEMLTIKDVFSVSPTKQVNVTYMRTSEDIPYAEDNDYLKCKVISKPYETKKNQEEWNEGRIMMHVVLPDGDIDELLEKLTPNNFEQMLKKGGEEKVVYALPKISVSSRYNFKDFLQKFYEKSYDAKDRLNFGVRGFESEDEGKKQFIDEITQETVLRVDEKGWFLSENAQYS